MYKKMLLSIMLVSILFFGLSKANIQNINIRYCEDIDAPRASLSKIYFVEPGKEKEICLYMYSSADIPIQVQYGYPEIELNAAGDRGCSNDMGPDNTFSKFFVNTGERVVTIEPGVPYLIKEKFFPPIGLSGEIGGCFVYTLATPIEKEGGAIFNVVTRKVYFLDFFVGGSESINSAVELLKNPGGVYSTNSKIKATLNEENDLLLSFKVKNNGNVTQNISIGGKIYNILGFEKSYENIPVNIPPGEIKDIDINVGIVPAYKGFFTVRYTINNTPVFGFDTSSMDDESKIGGAKTDKATIFVFSWAALIIIVLIVLLLIKLLLPRKVKVIKE